MTRVPYADRPEVRSEFCTCPKDEDGARLTQFIQDEDEYGRPFWLGWADATNPKCPLHGDDAKPAPF
jgi:hypothetical protein